MTFRFSGERVDCTKTGDLKFDPLMMGCGVHFHLLGHVLYLDTRDHV